MIKNITFSAEELLVKKARRKAEHYRTSLNYEFRAWLKRYAEQDNSSTNYLKLMKTLKHVSADRKFSREEMNAR